MALGTPNNNNPKQEQSISLYSKYAWYNKNSKVDASALSIEFGMNGLVKLQISPAITDEQGNTRYDHKNKGYIYLSYTQAFILSKEIREFMKAPTIVTDCGVNTRSGIVQLLSGEFFGNGTPVLTIKRLDQSGNIESTFGFEFRADSYGIRNFGESNSDVEKVAYPVIELELLANALEDFARYMSGAAAYSIQEYGKYNNSRINTKLDSLCKANGIEYGNGQGGARQSRAGSPNYSEESAMGRINNAETKSYEMKSLDSVDDFLM